MPHTVQFSVQISSKFFKMAIAEKYFGELFYFQSRKNQGLKDEAVFNEGERLAPVSPTVDLQRFNPGLDRPVPSVKSCGKSFTVSRIHFAHLCHYFFDH